MPASEDRLNRFYSTGLDVSSRAGFLLGAFYTGLSFQPNLLSRGTRDQAIISGVAASVGYAWGSSAHSFLRSTADRMPMSSRSTAGHAASGLIVDVAAAAVGAAIMKAVPPREHESSKRALIRLGGVGLTAAGLAGVGADSLEPTRGKPGFHAAGVATALATTVGAYLLTRPGTATRGALAPGETEARENVVREVSIPKALGSSLAVTAALFAVAKGESDALRRRRPRGGEGPRRSPRRSPHDRPVRGHGRTRRRRLGRGLARPTRSSARPASAPTSRTRSRRPCRRSPAGRAPWCRGPTRRASRDAG